MGRRKDFGTNVVHAAFPGKPFGKPAAAWFHWPRGFFWNGKKDKRIVMILLL